MGVDIYFVLIQITKLFIAIAFYVQLLRNAGCGGFIPENGNFNKIVLKPVVQVFFLVRFVGVKILSRSGFQADVVVVF